MLRMDSLLESALRIPVPEFRARSRRRASPVVGRLGIAAVAALVAVAAAWVVNGQRLGHSLARDVIAHVVQEPESLIPSRASLPAAAVSAVLAGRPVALPATLGEIVYAQTCVFRGRQVPHLVVRTPQGLVSVLILPDEHLRWSTALAERGLAAQLIVSGHGVVAVAADGRVTDRTKASVAAALASEV